MGIAMEKPVLPLLIGCDGGGSGCRVAIADGFGRVMAQSAGGPANVASDFDGALRALNAALADAAGQLGLSLHDLGDAVAHFGLAGVQSAQGSARVAAGLPIHNITVTEDRVVAVAGALEGADGVLLAIGTGTIIAAARAGGMRHVGGWGLQLSDQASGAWLGRGLLERVLLCHDGLEAVSDLTADAFKTFSNDPGALVRFAATASPSDYARLAPRVVQAAQAGDAGGVALMQAGAAYLTRALGAIGFGDGDALCLTGGVAPHYAPYLAATARAAIVPARGSGLDGALRLALAAAMARP
jgi:glucosamine kinase